MKATNIETAQQFSAGNFPACYDSFADNLTWNMVGANLISGKENVVAHCTNMMIDMASATLTNTTVITGHDHVVIEGNCQYRNENNQSCEVAYCDVFHFEKDKIAGITSYCIDRKSDG